VRGDLGTRGQSIGSTFASKFPDQLKRQRLWDFLYYNSGETRLAPQLGNIPYIFHTCDLTVDTPGVSKVHLACLRGKTGSSQPAKMAIYFEWAKCTTYPDGLAQDYEFYDYSAPANNTAEMGNDYSSKSPSPMQTAYMNAMGNWGGWSSPTPGSGLIASELNAPLTGLSFGGTALSAAQAGGQRAYLNFTFGSSGCP